MVNKSKRNLKVKNQLQDAGVLCATGGEYNQILYTTDMDGLATYMRDIDSQQFIQRYRWWKKKDGNKISGLTKSIPAFRVEQILYFRGTAVLFKVGKDFMFLPYAITSGYNAIGLPNEIKPVSFNGEYPEKEGSVRNYQLIIKNNGAENPNANAVILYDRYNGFGRSHLVGRYALSTPIIHQICNRFAYLGINIKNSQGKYIIVCKDEKIKDTLTQQLDELFASTKNYALLRSMFDVQISFNKVDYQEQQIWEDIASWDALRCQGLGIENNGLFNKKERKLSGELSGNQQSSNSILMNGLRARQEFVEQAKELWGNDPDFIEQFGEDWGVELSESFSEDEELEDETIESDEEENNNDDTDISI